MSIKSHLFYIIGNDEVIGFEDLGKGKTFKPALNSLVLMIKGIYSNRKLPLAYFFFFVIAFPLSPLRAYQVPCGRLFSSLFSYVVRRGSGVLSPATHAHPLSSPFSGRHNTNTTTHNIHGRPIRPGI
jgi:hypothetical protein